MGLLYRIIKDSLPLTIVLKYAIIYTNVNFLVLLYFFPKTKGLWEINKTILGIFTTKNIKIKEV